MRILLTGATGYIGKRLLPVLIQEGHEVVCCVRDQQRFQLPDSLRKNVTIIEIDLLVPESFEKIPNSIDCAFYLVHSMATSKHYADVECVAAENFTQRLNTTQVQQVIYLSGISNAKQLSEHLNSRKQVENTLAKGKFALTTIRAGIIIGSGSASFEIIRDLVEKLPVMVAPKWLNTKSQPIGISDVILILKRVMLKPKTYNQGFDIGGPDILSYKQMLLQFAQVRQLKRWILIVPVMTPRLSSYWLYFVTSTSYRLAVALVDSMKIEVVAAPSEIYNITKVSPISYTQALQKAFSKIAQNEIVSSWKDAFISGNLAFKISDFIHVPTFGCFLDHRTMTYKSRSQTINRIWKLGGNTGWYYANWLWSFRGFMDRMVGGVGLRRGRTSLDEITAGDTLDFWRVLYANKEEGHLLLFAEMKLPGEAWLEFKLVGDKLEQKATFRPKGLGGRLYWALAYPFHGFIFKGMLKAMCK